MQFVWVALYLVLNVAGLVFIKLGVDSVQASVSDKAFQFSMSWQSLVGYTCYLASFLLYTLKILKDFNLSYIIPLCAGIAQVMILLAAVYVFKEQLSWATVVGAALIIAGVVLLNVKV